LNADGIKVTGGAKSGTNPISFMAAMMAGIDIVLPAQAPEVQTLREVAGGLFGMSKPRRAEGKGGL